LPSSLIIGAGIAGLTAARELARRGWDIIVLDKGRGVGGRMATRRIEQARADHGAQYCAAYTPKFQEFIAELQQAGAVTTWDIAGGYVSGQPPFYIGTEGMNRIPKYLAETLTVQTNEKVLRVHQDSSWHVETETGSTYRADALLITTPAPQALALFEESNLVLEAQDRQALSAIHYQPCLAVVVALQQSARIPAPGALRFETGDIAWVADNQQKGISPDQPSVTIHANPAFSQAHLEADLNELGQQLIAQLPDLIPQELVRSYQVHRWRYSFAVERYPEPFLNAKAASPLLFGGDGFGIGNVEGAYLSGLEMARHLIGR
jgi:renalase